MLYVANCMGTSSHDVAKEALKMTDWKMTDLKMT